MYDEYKDTVKQLAQDIFECGDALEAPDFLYVDNILDTHFARIARKLIDKGYRKQEDTLKRFIKWQKEFLVWYITKFDLEKKALQEIIDGLDDDLNEFIKEETEK